MADRVRRPHQYDEFLTELTKEKEVFKTYKDALVFAACLGFSRDKRISFDKSSEPINIQVFSGTFDQMIMNTLAIGELDDPYVMSNGREDEKICIFEEYACGGLEILQDEIGQGQIALDEGILTMIMQEEESEGILDEITDLGKI